MKTKSIAALILCVSILFSLCACNKPKATQKDSTADEVSVAVSTFDEVTTDSKEITTTVKITTQSTASTTEQPTSSTKAEESTTKQDTPKTTKPANSASNKPVSNNSGSTNNKKPTNNNNVSNSDLNAGPVDSKPMTCIITVDNKDYTAEYGDILTYSYYLKTPKEVECVQAYINYTPECLQLLEDKDETMLPVINSGAIINTDTPGNIRYNAIDISGYDFTKEAVLITLRFKVIFGGSGSIYNVLEFLDEKGGKSYVENLKISKDVERREVLK